ncbi:single-stranded-DNA-specific exonuclease RecJ [Treponema sp. HNW]|uniref:single-stranded-DNA-specific exonuclease RecJ n=1 Tax=Treponema sp. HNW TaxID=3116654 RepID=UPI003D11DDA5
MNWLKKEISKETVKELHERYGCDALSASILARRGITSGADILFYMEDDKRYLHNPFLFEAMEDAVDRILQARDEGEKVLIFGDRDVDGISSTTILYEYLSKMGIDVSWKLPQGNDDYGLSISCVEEFAASYGSLIITVDCGISNHKEIAKAAESGIDVIVVDHHTVPDEVPSPAIIINPKMPGTPYPFKEISGCAAVYKLLCALRFSQSELYKQEICLLNVRPLNDSYLVEALKTVNLCEKERIEEIVVPGVVSIQETRLVKFFHGQQIVCWDAPLQQKMLTKAFGTGVEFNMLDIRPEIARKSEALAQMSLLRLKIHSRIGRYREGENGELDAFFNLFVTYAAKHASFSEAAGTGAAKTTVLAAGTETAELQLTALAALADIVPLKNENRILVRQGLASINEGRLRPGLSELFTRMGLHGTKMSSVDLSWKVIPLLNAAGRLGRADLAVRLFTEQEPAKRSALADELFSLNEQRKLLTEEAVSIAAHAARESLSRFSGNLAVAADKRIHRGVTGIAAGRLASSLQVPVMVITFFDDGKAVGSIRSALGYDITSLLNSCGDLFLNYGGHAFAGGFSFESSKFEEILQRLENLAAFMELNKDAGEADLLNIDAELPPAYMTAGLLDLIDRFEPYGEENPLLLFGAQKLKIAAADIIIGKKEKPHLKLTLDCGKNKWPAFFWEQSERLKRDFDVGDRIDIIFNIERNTFNGMEKPQIILKDCKKSD